MPHIRTLRMVLVRDMHEDCKVNANVQELEVVQPYMDLEILKWGSAWKCTTLR